MTRDEIITDLWGRQSLDEAWMIAGARVRDDFKIYIFEIILKLSDEKFWRLWNDGELEKWIIGVCKIQGRLGKKLRNGKPTSHFWREMGEFNEVSGGVMLDFFESSEYNSDDIDYFFKNYEKILTDFQKVNINNINYFYNRVIFEMCYKDGLSLVKISEKTGIKYNNIRKSFRFTTEFIKKNIRVKIYD